MVSKPLKSAEGTFKARKVEDDVKSSEPPTTKRLGGRRGPDNQFNATRYNGECDETTVRQGNVNYNKINSEWKVFCLLSCQSRWQPLIVKSILLAEEQQPKAKKMLTTQTIHQPVPYTSVAQKFHSKGKAEAVPVENALQKPCDPKPKLDHQPVQQMVPDVFRVAVINKAESETEAKSLVFSTDGTRLP